MKDNEYISQITRSELKEIIFECLEEVQLLKENTIYKDNKYSMHMDGMITASINYYADPYVKIADSPSWTRSKNCLLYFFKDKSVGYHEEGKGDLRFKVEIGEFINKSLAIELRPGYKVVDYLNESIYSKFSSDPRFDKNKLYIIQLDDYRNSTYRKKPTRRER